MCYSGVGTWHWGLVFCSGISVCYLLGLCTAVQILLDSYLLIMAWESPWCLLKPVYIQGECSAYQYCVVISIFLPCKAVTAMVGSKVMLFICSTPPNEEVDAFLAGVEVGYPCVCDCRRS